MIITWWTQSQPIPLTVTSNMKQANGLHPYNAASQPIQSWLTIIQPEDGTADTMVSVYAASNECAPDNMALPWLREWLTCGMWDIRTSCVGRVGPGQGADGGAAAGWWYSLIDGRSQWERSGGERLETLCIFLLPILFLFFLTLK